MTRASAAHNPGVSLFPFLAVLICTMGVMMLLLVIINRPGAAAIDDSTPPPDAIFEEGGKGSAATLASGNGGASSAANDELQSAREMLDWRISQLETSREKTIGDLRNERLRLATVEDGMRKLHDQWELVKKAVGDLAQADNAKDHDKQSVAAFVDRLKSDLNATHDRIGKAVQEARTEPPAYAIVPYDGPNGTRRQPIYIECRNDAVVLQPEGIELTEDDFKGPPGPGNPLASTIRAARDYLAGGTAPTPGREPYPLLIVRSDGIVAFYMARAAMSSWASEYGYELIESDRKLVFQPPNPQLAQLEKATLTDARQRYAWFATTRTGQEQRNRRASGPCIAPLGPAESSAKAKHRWPMPTAGRRVPAAAHRDSALLATDLPAAEPAADTAWNGRAQEWRRWMAEPANGKALGPGIGGHRNGANGLAGGPGGAVAVRSRQRAMACRQRRPGRTTGYGPCRATAVGLHGGGRRFGRRADRFGLSGARRSSAMVTGKRRPARLVVPAMDRAQPFRRRHRRLRQVAGTGTGGQGSGYLGLSGDGGPSGSGSGNGTGVAGGGPNGGPGIGPGIGSGVGPTGVAGGQPAGGSGIPALEAAESAGTGSEPAAGGGSGVTGYGRAASGGTGVAECQRQRQPAYPGGTSGYNPSGTQKLATTAGFSGTVATNSPGGLQWKQRRARRQFVEPAERLAGGSAVPTRRRSKLHAATGLAHQRSHARPIRRRRRIVDRVRWRRRLAIRAALSMSMNKHQSQPQHSSSDVYNINATPYPLAIRSRRSRIRENTFPAAANVSYPTSRNRPTTMRPRRTTVSPKSAATIGAFPRRRNCRRPSRGRSTSNAAAMV